MSEPTDNKKSRISEVSIHPFQPMKPDTRSSSNDLGSKEIINEINDYCQYFSEMDSIKSQDLITKVTNIKNRIDKIYNQSDIYIKKLIDEQFMTINALGIRTDREGYFDTIINKIENNYRSDKK